MSMTGLVECSQCHKSSEPGAGRESSPARPDLQNLFARERVLLRDFDEARLPYMVHIAGARGSPGRYFEPKGPASYGGSLSAIVIMALGLGAAFYVLWLGAALILFGGW